MEHVARGIEISILLSVASLSESFHLNGSPGATSFSIVLHPGPHDVCATFANSNGRDEPSNLSTEFDRIKL